MSQPKNKLSQLGWNNNSIKRKSSVYKRADTDKEVEYKRIKIIGKGSFGVVHSAIDSNFELVAVKSKKHIKNKKLMSISSDLFKSEIEALHGLKHPNICRLVIVVLFLCIKNL